jgi:hypothetical protein
MVVSAQLCTKVERRIPCFDLRRVFARICSLGQGVQEFFNPKMVNSARCSPLLSASGFSGLADFQDFFTSCP